jgi:hypothetical protein
MLDRVRAWNTNDRFLDLQFLDEANKTPHFFDSNNNAKVASIWSAAAAAAAAAASTGRVANNNNAGFWNRLALDSLAMVGSYATLPDLLRLASCSRDIRSRIASVVQRCTVDLNRFEGRLPPVNQLCNMAQIGMFRRMRHLDLASVVGLWRKRAMIYSDATLGALAGRSATTDADRFDGCFVTTSATSATSGLDISASQSAVAVTLNDLTAIDLRGFPVEPPGFLAIQRAAPNVVECFLGEHNVLSYDNFEALWSWPRLRRLSLAGVKFRFEKCRASIRLPNSVIRMISTCSPQLEELSLAGSDIGEDGCRALMACKQLLRLNLSRCEYMTNEALQILRGLPRLEILHLQECKWLDMANHFQENYGQTLGSFLSLVLLDVTSCRNIEVDFFTVCVSACVFFANLSISLALICFVVAVCCGGLLWHRHFAKHVWIRHPLVKRAIIRHTFA